MLRVGSFNAVVRRAADADWKWIRTTAVPQIRGLLSRANGEAWQAIGHDVLERLRPHLSIVVCEISEGEPVLLGWRAELDGERVYEYVTRGYRGRGIGRAMRAEMAKARAA
jgi:GNAT superfamily N-acetyltransferase